MEKILRLPVNEYWYNLIKSGKLTHDYREIKPYWSKRLDGQTYDIVEFYHRFKKDIKPLRYKFEWIEVGRLVNYNMDAYIIKFGDEINSIEEGLFTNTVKRGYTDEKRKEDIFHVGNIKPRDYGTSVLWADNVIDGTFKFKDAINNKYSDGWRLPTKEEMEELIKRKRLRNVSPLYEYKHFWAWTQSVNDDSIPYAFIYNAGEYSSIGEIHLENAECYVWLVKEKN